MKTMLRRFLQVATLTLLVNGTALAQNPSTEAVPDDLRAALENLRSDASAFKIRTLNQVLELTGPEADKFWPVYRKYEKELASLNDKKIALLRDFGQRCSSGTLDAQTAHAMAEQWLKNAQARLDLWKKYQKKIAKAVSPARAVQFLQVEHQMALFVDLNVASEMPVLKKVTKPTAP
jgi:hypothetical protein